jgi:hypothetical protein
MQEKCLRSVQRQHTCIHYYSSHRMMMAMMLIQVWSLDGTRVRRCTCIQDVSGNRWPTLRSRCCPRKQATELLLLVSYVLDACTSWTYIRRHSSNVQLHHRKPLTSLHRCMCTSQPGRLHMCKPTFLFPSGTLLYLTYPNSWNKLEGCPLGKNPAIAIRHGLPDAAQLAVHLHHLRPIEIGVRAAGAVGRDSSRLGRALLGLLARAFVEVIVAVTRCRDGGGAPSLLCRIGVLVAAATSAAVSPWIWVFAEEVLDGCKQAVPVLLDLCPERKHVKHECSCRCISNGKGYFSKTKG